MSVADVYLRMLAEAKKKEEDKLDPVGQEDGDVDNDGDKDSSDEYLMKRRKAIKKSMKNEAKVECPKCEGEGCDHCDNKGYHEEAVEIDPDNGDVTKSKKDKKSKKGEEEKTDMTEQAKPGPNPADQEKLEPRAKGEKAFKDMHKVGDVKDERGEHEKDVKGMTAGVKQAPARPGDNKQGDKMKTFKDIRK